MDAVSHSVTEVSTGDDLALLDQAASSNAPAPDRLQFWEAQHTRPAFQTGDQESPELVAAAENYLGTCMAHPYLPVSQIRDQQFARIKELVEMAYREIPVYRAKYKAAGFKPSHLRQWDDIQKIPVITKPELVAAFPDQCVNKKYKSENLFPTRSSGSSGQTLLIRVDYDAILTDTIQGVRQFAMQSGFNYQENDLLAHVYTVPWWFDSIGGKYPTAFISNIIPPARVAQHLRYLGPKMLSLYPSSLDALMPHVDEFRSSLNLAVTHSEYSSRVQRQEWSRQLGVPVLDEYSSEEATRIALEMQDGNYYVCEDTVHLDVLDPVTMEPQAPGQSGIAVITNLLNEAMPFIRYVQGDYITQPVNPAASDINWSQIASIDGRLNDAFINRDGRKVPAGSILDATYRWMFDCNLHLVQFEIVQSAYDQVEARVVLSADTPGSRLKGSIAHLEDLLSVCLEHPVHVKSVVLDAFPPKTGKRRPIRREMARTRRKLGRKLGRKGTCVVTESMNRMAAMTARYFYLLRSSWLRLLELVYWPAMSMLVWGFLYTYLYDSKSSMASTGGMLLGAVLLWDVLFRGQLGFSFTFLEEIWSRNLANLMMSPLQPAELAASLMLMSLIRLLIGTIPVTLLVWLLFGFNIYGLGFGLLAFFINLVMTGWAIGLVVSGMIIRQGLGAESLAYSIMILVLPLCCVYYPVWVLPLWLQPAAWSLTPTYVFEGMRAILLDGVVRTDLMVECFALNLVYLGLAFTTFMLLLRSARHKGVLLTMGE